MATAAAEETPHRDGALVPVPPVSGPAPGVVSIAAKRRRQPNTLVRLIAVQVLLVGIALTVVVIETVAIFAGNYHRDLRADLGEEVTEYSQAAHLRPQGQSLYEYSRTYLATHTLSPGHELVVALDGQPILGSRDASTIASAPAFHGWLTQPLTTARYVTVHTGGARYEVLLSPIIAGTRRVGVLVPFANLSSLDAQAARIRRAAEIQAAIALVATALSSFLVLRHLLRIVGRVTDTAEEIADGDLDRRIDYHGPDDEVGRLATSFDSMTDRVATAMAAQRQLLSDVSHQLRTPLTVARGHLEVLLRGPGGDDPEVSDTVGLVVDELYHAGLLVDRLLLLGRLLEPDFIVVEPVDLRAFMADVFDAATILADRRWRLAPVPDLVIAADGAKVRGALLNLIDNAVKATCADDTVAISATVAGSSLVLTVGDSGRGIPYDLQDLVFDRFRRGDQAHQRGSGLGLAIVKAVAEGHGGSCHLSSTPGEGCEISMVLPIGSPGAAEDHPWPS